jgi:hypothetical protein
MLCTPGLLFGGIVGVRSRFNVLRARTHLRRYRRRRFPFSCFALSNTFSTVWRASGPVFIFCAPGLVFGGFEVVGSRFYVLRARFHFQRYRVCRVRFSCFTLPDLLSSVPRASAPVFMFYAPGLVFDGIEGVESRFRDLRSQTHFRR